MKQLFKLLCVAGLLCPLSSFSQVNVKVLNKAMVQNFDSLARNGTSSVMPAGWHLYQTNNTLTYRANQGDSSRPDVYSYGRNGFTGLNRALGSISGSGDITWFGAEFENNTGFLIDQLTIAYTIEQWRLGATGRADTTEFDFSTDATSLTGTGAKWTNISGLDMISPVTKGTVGLLNGLSTLNQSKVSFKLTGLKIANGGHFWIRWYDHAISGPNDGLAVENFSITPVSTIAGPTVVKRILDGKFPQTAGIPDTTVYGKFHGIVLSPNFVSNGGLQFSLRDSFVPTGFQAGMGAITCISKTDMGGYKVNIGDSLYVTGKIRSYHFLTYIELDTLIVLQSAKVADPAPITSTVLNYINDNNESNLIFIKNASLTATAKWDTTGASLAGGFTTTARGQLGNFFIFIDKNSDLFLKPKPGFSFNIRGIALQNSTGAATAGYFLWPRFVKDIDTIPPPPVLLHNIGQVNTFRTTPIRLYGQADSAGHKVMLKGVVHSANLFFGGTYFNLIDRTGAITVFANGTVNGYNAKTGDSILVRGTIAQPQGGLIVIAADSISMLPKGTTLTPPKIISAPITKPLESFLGTLKKVKIADPSAWDTTLASKTLNWFEVKITNGPDTFFMDISKTTDLFKSAVISGQFSVTGVIGEASTNPNQLYNDHYLLIPRGSFDIVPLKMPLYKIGQIKGYNPKNGRADSLGVYCFIKGVVQSGNINDTAAEAFAIADNTGAITGINVYNLNYNPVIGDSIILSGFVAQVAGFTYFAPDSIHLLNAGNTILSPVLVSAMDEPDESALITMQGYTMWNPNQWDNLAPANRLGFNVQFVRGSDTIIVHISHNVKDLYNLPYAGKPTGKVDITGIEFQKTNPAKAPFANYFLVPRMISDFAENTGIASSDWPGNTIRIYPNPARDKVIITSSAAINKITVTDLLGNIRIDLDQPGLVSVPLDLISLKGGIYFVWVKNSLGTSVEKIILQ